MSGNMEKMGGGYPSHAPCLVSRFSNDGLEVRWTQVTLPDAPVADPPISTQCVAPADGQRPSRRATDNLYGFLTTEPNREVGAVHPKAMPVILTRQEDMDVWMTGPVDEALRLQGVLAEGPDRQGTPDFD